MKWLKKMAIDFAAGYAKKYVSIENILNWASLGLTTLLRKVTENKDTDKIERICTSCELYGAVLAEITKSAKDGTVTAEEMASILVKLQEATNIATITDDKISKLIDKSAKALKERI